MIPGWARWFGACAALHVALEAAAEATQTEGQWSFLFFVWLVVGWAVVTFMFIRGK